MSVIGPRPLLVEYLPYYTKEEKGLTEVDGELYYFHPQDGNAMKAVYNKYWQKQMQDLKAEIDTIQDLTYATNLINEQKMLRRISSDIPEFMEFLRDCKSLSLSEHIENKFSEMIKFMGIK